MKRLYIKLLCLIWVVLCVSCHNDLEDAFYDDEHKITDSITSKEVTFIETNCFSIYGDDGKIDGQKYKLVLKDQDAYEVKYIGKERLAVGGQC